MDVILCMKVFGEISNYFVLLATAVNFHIFFSPFLKNKKTKYITDSLFTILTMVSYHIGRILAPVLLMGQSCF